MVKKTFSFVLDDEEVADKLEGYAFATRRTRAGLIREIVMEWFKANQDEIEKRQV